MGFKGSRVRLSWQQNKIQARESRLPDNFLFLFVTCFSRQKTGQGVLPSRLFKKVYPPSQNATGKPVDECIAGNPAKPKVKTLWRSRMSSFAQMFSRLSFEGLFSEALAKENAAAVRP